MIIADSYKFHISFDFFFVIALEFSHSSKTVSNLSLDMLENNELASNDTKQFSVSNSILLVFPFSSK
jgi:hypothetical protein